MPFFTIIIPTLNSSLTIGSCINSLLKQCFHDFDILVKDGGSSDKTISIIKRFVEEDCRVRWFSEPDEGIYDAMNTGIEISFGDYLYFLGSDDVLFNERVLQEVAEQIKENNFPDFVYGNVLLGNSNKVYDGEFSLRKLFDNNICQQGIFYRRSVFLQMGKFEPRFPTLADWHFNFRCFVSPLLRKVYISSIIARFALGGKSSGFIDPLYEARKTIFLEIARIGPRFQTHLLRGHFAKKRTFCGMVCFAYHHFFYSFFWAIDKCFKKQKKYFGF